MAEIRRRCLPRDRPLRISRHGEIRDRTTEGQHFRVAGLNLLATIVIYWNTLHLGHAVAQRHSDGLSVPPELLAHISPLGWAHILLTGEYRWPRTVADTPWSVIYHSAVIDPRSTDGTQPGRRSCPMQASGTPLVDADGGLCGELVPSVAEEQQIGKIDTYGLHNIASRLRECASGRRRRVRWRGLVHGARERCRTYWRWPVRTAAWGRACRPVPRCTPD